MMPMSTTELDSGCDPAVDPAARLPYEAPELVDQGEMAELTKSGIPTVPGPDAGYS
jgi:hypothetical protein